MKTYGIRSETRYENSSELQRIFSFKIFQEIEDDSFSKWLVEKAVHTRNNVGLVFIFAQECRDKKIILIGMTVIERLCADARVIAERKVVEVISLRIDKEIKKKLENLLGSTIDARLTIHGWLKRFEISRNSTDVNRLLNKLDYL